MRFVIELNATVIVLASFVPWLSEIDFANIMGLLLRRILGF